MSLLTIITPVSCFQKEDLSDGENSESLSSVPDSESGVPEPPAPDTRDKEPGPRSSHQPVPASSLSPGVGPPQPPPIHRVKQPRAQGLTPPAQASKPLTSLANLSPTPKSLLTGLLHFMKISYIMTVMYFSGVPLGSGDLSRPQSSSSRSSCEYQQSPGAGEAGAYTGHMSAEPGPFPRGQARAGQYYRGYTAGQGSPLQQYCSNNAAASPGYHYQYSGHQTNGGGYRTGAGMQVTHGDQYGGYPGGYPGYYDQAQLAGGHQGATGGYYPGPNSGYSKQSAGFSDSGVAGPGYPGYPGPEAKSGSGYYYPSCQGGAAGQSGGQPDPATANTPLPPDFSYVGSGGQPGGHHGEQGGGYQDFYAMG